MPQAAKTRRSIEEIRKELSSSLKPWSRPFCPTCSMTKETGVTAVDLMDEKQLAENPQLDKARERTQCTGAAAGEEKHGTAVEESPRKSDSPDARADTRRRAR